jgi:hypothetical protein
LASFEKKYAVTTEILFRSLIFAAVLLGCGAASSMGGSQTSLPRLAAIQNAASREESRSPASEQQTQDDANRIQAAKEALLNLQHRPTIIEFLRAMGDLPSENPFKPLDRDMKIEKIETIGPRIVAAIEYAYPGATWAILGRDSAFMGDVLEAFYHQNGAADRVVRLNASTDSFATPGQELRFLYSAGLLSSPDTKTQKKWTILDPTSWAIDNDGKPTSQIRKLLAAYYAKHGDAEARRMVGAIGLGTSGRGLAKGPEIVSGLDIERFWHDTKNSPSGGPNQILYTLSDFAYLALNPSNNTEVAWHDKFGAFQDAEGGKVIAPPGRQSSPQFKEHILYTMFEAVRATRKASFRDDVVRTAKSDFGYDFEKTLGDDLKKVENAEGFAKLLDHGWTAGEIGQWANELFDGLPRSVKGFAIVSKIRLAAHGYSQGTVTQSQLKDFVEEGLDNAGASGELSEFFAGILSRRISFAGDNVIHEIVNGKNWSKPGEGLLSISRAMMEQGNSEHLPSAFNGHVSNEVKKMMTTSPGLGTVSGAIELRHTALSLANSPEDFMKIFDFGISNPSDDFKTALSALIAGSIDAAIKKGLSIRQVNVLKGRMNVVADVLTMIKAGLKLVRTGYDFLQLAEYGYDNPSEYYREKMAEFIVAHVDVAVNAGASIDVINDLKIRTITVDQTMAVMKAGLKAVKSGDDFLKLLQWGFSNPSDAYKDAMRGFILNNISTAIRAGATIESINNIKMRVSGVADVISIMTAALPLVKSGDDFVKLTDFWMSNPSDAYKDAVSSFIDTHINVAINAGISIKQIGVLKRRMNEVNALMRVMSAALPLVQTASDFEKLTRYEVGAPSDFYRSKMAKFIAEHKPQVSPTLTNGKKPTIWARFKETALARTLGFGQKPEERAQVLTGPKPDTSTQRPKSCSNTLIAGP